MDRRLFVKLTGLGALGLAARPALDLFAAAEIPAHSPLAQRRWAMVMDLRKCQEAGDCEVCIAACHQAHNVPKMDRPDEEIKWVWKESFHHTFHDQEHPYLDEQLRHGPVLVTCNHCENPPCVRVCPTQATWKRDDGIVMMDWHRCIGCRYCIVGCPYGSRSFNWQDPRKHLAEPHKDFPTRTKGVVEKCTLCEERLTRNQLPACVEACPAGALVFGDLGDPDSPVRELLKSRYTLRRKPNLGTQPQVYYIV
ncbi:MAG: 4Fe-4S dicluster domain-containing protein [Candidatus Zixiibacteriota bacterium]|nr:MAG: 4Fe-4S dicluster domain-containing protein [candidate division Zixibacteria bacterium]